MKRRLQPPDRAEPRGYAYGVAARGTSIYVAEAQPIRPSSRYSISAFCACMRFSASSQTTD
jgi:hypothetical protein